MKIFLICLLLLARFSVSAQNESIDLQESPVTYIRQGNFHAASVVIDSMVHNKEYLFIFGITLPVQQAFDGDTLCRQFLKYNGRNQYLLSPFCRVMHDLNDYEHAGQEEKQVKARALIESMERTLGSVPDVLTLYGIWVAQCRLADWPENSYRNRLLKNFCLKLSDVPVDSADRCELAMLKLLRFQSALIGSYPDPRLQVTRILEHRFSLDEGSVLAAAPFYHDKTIFPDVFDTKMQLIRNNKALLPIKAQQTYAMGALIENPSGKHLKQVRRYFDSHADFRAGIERSFNTQYIEPNFPAEIRDFVAANRKTGQWIVVDFWGTWCEPCVAELPQWQQLYEKQDSRITFAALSVYSKEVETFLHSHQFTFPNFNASDEQTKILGLRAYPTTFLISPEGKAVILSADRKQEQICVLTGVRTNYKRSRITRHRSTF